MRTAKEIRDKISKYESAVKQIRNDNGKVNLRYMIAELLWCLGEDGI